MARTTLTPGRTPATADAAAAALAVRLRVGDHLVTPRRGYLHHGIYVGDGRVVHYAGLFLGIHRGPVTEVPLARFGAGREIRVKRGAQRKYARHEIAARALSRLGEDRYRLFTNNCEHFCEWCIRGEHRSEQIDRWRAWPRRAAGFLIGLIGPAFGVLSGVAPVFHS